MTERYLAAETKDIPDIRGVLGPPGHQPVDGCLCPWLNHADCRWVWLGYSSSRWSLRDCKVVMVSGEAAIAIKAALSLITSAVRRF